MVRRYKRKTNRATRLPADEQLNIIRRVEMVTEQLQGCSTYPGQPYEATLINSGICRTVKDCRQICQQVSPGTCMQVFNTEQESKLAGYLKHAAEIYFGLSPNELRILAYQCAKRVDIPVP